MFKTHLDQKFWNEFAKKTWEKKPLAIRRVDSSVLLIDAEQIFNLLVRYSDRCRKTKNLDGLKLYLDGERQFSDEVLELLPTKRDESLEGYHSRMNEMFADYCLVCDELLQLDTDVWQELLKFTKSLHQSVGLPNRFSEIGLYLGNYKKTPFGVHVDNCGVFSFPVVGTKRFRIWKPEFVNKHPKLVRSHRYERYKKASQLLQASPGDMTYWPSNAWHISESDGSFTATWSLGVWVDKPFQNVTLDALAPLIQKKLNEKSDKTTTPFHISPAADGCVDTLTKIHLGAIAALKTISEDELHDAYLRAWTIHNSKQGFKTVPKRSDIAQFKLNSRIQLQTSLPILWSQFKTEPYTLFAFAGTAVDRKTSRGFLKLVQALNSGKVCQINKYIKGGSAKQELVLLQSLAEAGAIVPVEKTLRDTSLHD